MLPQMSVKAYETNVASFKDGVYLSSYNSIYEYMLLELFFKLTDFTILLDSDLWRDEEGNQGESPFDAMFRGSDLLSSRTLEYWDFLVSNAPWFNAISGQAVDDARALAKEHDKQSSIICLENMLSPCACRKLCSKSALEFDGPAKRCQVMWSEERSPAVAAAASGKQQSR